MQFADAERRRRRPRPSRAIVAVVIVAVAVGGAVWIGVAAWSAHGGGASSPTTPPSPPGTRMISGHPVPYRDLPAFGQSQFVRDTDFCGFLTADLLRGGGEVEALGPTSTHTCGAELSGTSQSPSGIGVLAAPIDGPPGANVDVVGAKTTQRSLSGLDVTIADQGSICLSQVPIAPPSDPRFEPPDDIPGITRPPAPLSLQFGVSSTRNDPVLCEIAANAAAHAAELITAGRFPRLAGSAFAGVPLRSEDPCGIVERLPARFRLENRKPSFDIGHNMCAMTVSEGSSAGRLTELEYSAEPDGQLGRDRAGLTSSKIAGRRVFTKSDKDSCVSTTNVGRPSIFPPHAGPPAPTILYGAITVSAYSCEVSTLLLTSAADLAEHR